MIKYILLDVDDTILDFGKSEKCALGRTFETVGIPLNDAVAERYSAINMLQWEALERGEITREQVLVRRFELLLSELGLSIPAEPLQAMYERYLAEEHWFVDGAPELLRSLYGKYKLYIVSNGTAFVQDRRLHDAGITELFDGIFISERIGHDKPSKAFFDAALGSIEGFNADEAILLGDSLTSDILGGINAGVKTCWFNPKGKPARADIVPDFEIRKPSEFTELVNKL